ncbi:MAG: CPBP family intramembrane metalloprotease [Proteobacteria bacterium]|nr:CPBP family intramembrane metalloprotease [Pseudomonadota bacterium]
MTMTQTYPAQATPGALRVLAKATFSGIAVAGLSLVVWNGLLIGALRNPQWWTWIVPVMAAVLVGTAAYLRWGTWPKSGRVFRREGLRFNRVPLKTILFSLVAGWSTMIAGFCVYVAHRSLLGMGGEVPITLPHAPFALLLPGLLMGAFVAGCTEEVAFRGFMQRTLEKRFGVVPAILFSGLVWGLFHTNHSYFGEEIVVWLGIFLSVAAMLGTFAYRTNSVIPGILVHSGFDAAYFVAAGALQPRIAPIAWLQSIASPTILLVAASLAATIAFFAWISFLRATKNRGE